MAEDGVDMPTNTKNEHQPRSVVAVFGDAAGFGGRAQAGVFQYARERQHWIVRKSRREFSVKSLHEVGAAGVIGQFASERMSEIVRSYGAPVVNVSRVAERPFPLVTMNNEAIGRMAAQHLLDRGYRHLFCVSGKVIYAHERARGFEEVAFAADCMASTVVLDDIAPRRDHELEFERQVAAWMSNLPRPCGVFFAFWGAEAFAPVIHAAQVRVPEDVAMVMVGDDPVRCEREDPPVSTVDYPAEHIGYRAAQLLDAMMDGQPAPKRPILIDPTGVTERASSSAVAVNDPDVQFAAQYIRRNACRDFDFRRLEEEITVSRRTLERRFRALLGRTLQEEVLRVQMEQAKYLLAETDLSLQMVAARSGMSGAQRLCHAFKEHMGMTPKQYRMSGRPHA